MGHCLIPLNTCTQAYLAAALFLAGRVSTSIIAFSAAVSVKMSALLFGPPMLVACLRWATPRAVGVGVLGGGALQVALASPFLAAAPWSYAARAFELSRAFLYK
jgi:alpha-1,3-mannosyltransferase